MRVLYSDGQLMRWGGQLHLAHLGTWCVLGPGYICAVVTVEEGYRVMADLKSAGERRGITVEYEHGCIAGESPRTAGADRT